MKKTGFSVITILFVVTTTMAQLPEKAEDISPLLYGETMPDATLVDTEGDGHQLYSLIKEKPSILLFYRGGWCPYCNRHLSEIQEVEEQVANLGFQIIAISPDSPGNLQVTDHDQKLNYRLFSDAGGELCKKAGIAFKAPEKYGNMLKDKSGGQNEEGFLPVPAVFVVDNKGVILFEYINPDYSTRLSGSLLIAVLSQFKSDN
jgi:peroxiredoxin